MFLVTLLLVNVCLAAIVWVYLKLTCGICRSSRHLVGKVVVVTGANVGIGLETARDLADRGARVILGCRNEQRGINARDHIITLTGNKDVHFRRLDLASFASVRQFAKEILQTETKLHILINNAGLISDYVTTEDGLPLTIQANHFGPFLLTTLLLPLIKSSAPSRIVNVSSAGYRRGTVDFQNLKGEKDTKDNYSSFGAYAQSKLCNILMTVELERRLRGTRVTANSLHPGAVNTDIIKEDGPYKFLLFLKPFFANFVKTTWEGAQTTIYLAVSPEVEEVSGKYFSDCHETVTTGQAQDKELARKLWDFSKDIVAMK